MERKLSDAASKLPETELDFNAIQPVPKSGHRSRTWLAIASAAACFLLVISVGLITAEAREYSEAVAFFDEYGLSTDGLSRDQIKEIYRDITTKTFTYSKTAEVIINSISTEQVGGYEIRQDQPTPEDIRNLWNDKNYNGMFVPYVPDAYQFQVEPIWDDKGVWVDELYYLEKYEGDTVLWRTYLPFWLGDYYEVEDGVIVFGKELSHHLGSAETEVWVMKLDHNGKILWSHRPDNGFSREDPKGILENADGSYTFFSSAENRYLCVSRYTADGERTLYRETDLGKHSVGHIAHYGDGFLVQIYGIGEDEIARFLQVDQAGNVVDGFSYTDARNDYVIQDMTQWGGRVYVSAYATPKREVGELSYGGRGEISGILDYIFNLERLDISDEELTPMVRDCYAAVLLVCDPRDSGSLEVFYSIPGSLGAGLIVTEDGRLIWETESITTTFFSPATSSFTIGGVCHIYQYAFDDSGTLIGRGKTGEMTNFRR